MPGNVSTEDAIKTIRECVSLLTSLADALMATTSSDESPPEISFTDLRGKLADKARAGFTDQIRELLTRHGAQRLSDIEPAEYAALLAEVEAL